MKENKKNIIITVVVILFIIVLMVGLTYAYFMAKDTSNEQNIITNNLSIVFNDNTNIINNNNIMPISEKDILTKATKKSFSINVASNVESYVRIGLNINKIDEKLKISDFKWALYETTSDFETKISEGDFTLANINEEYILKNNIEFNSSIEKNYNLYIWIQENNMDQNALQGKIFEANIVAEAYSKRNLVYNSINAYKITSTTVKDSILRTATNFKFANIDKTIFKSDGTDILSIDYRCDVNNSDGYALSMLLKNNKSLENIYSGNNILSSGLIPQENILISNTLTTTLTDLTSALENDYLTLFLYYSPMKDSKFGTQDWLFNIDDIKINGISIKDKIVEVSTDNNSSITETIVQYPHNIYQNKKVAIIGDSITTTGAYNTGSIINNGYWSIINNNLGFSELDVNGWSGSSISHEASYTDKRYTKRYLELSDNNDLVLVFGGTNDYFSNSELGTIDDEPSDENFATFYSSLKFLVEGLKEKNQTGDIVFITPLPRTQSGKNSIDLTLKDYVNAIKNVADLYDLNVCDMYTQSGFRVDNSDWVSKYMPDGVHPNQLGHNILGEKITECLAGL